LTVSAGEIWHADRDDEVPHRVFIVSRCGVHRQITSDRHAIVDGPSATLGGLPRV
jgi:hypothetical protein